MRGERVAGQQARRLDSHRCLNRAILETVPKMVGRSKIYNAVCQLGPDTGSLQRTLRERARWQVRGHQPDCRIDLDDKLLWIPDQLPPGDAHKYERVMGHRSPILLVDMTIGDQGIHPSQVGRYEDMCRGTAVCLAQEAFWRIKPDPHGLAMREFPTGHDWLQDWLERSRGQQTDARPIGLCATAENHQEPGQEPASHGGRPHSDARH